MGGPGNECRTNNGRPSGQMRGCTRDEGLPPREPAPSLFGARTSRPKTLGIGGPALPPKNILLLPLISILATGSGATSMPNLSCPCPRHHLVGHNRVASSKAPDDKPESLSSYLQEPGVKRSPGPLLIRTRQLPPAPQNENATTPPSRPWISPIPTPHPWSKRRRRSPGEEKDDPRPLISTRYLR